MASPIAVPSVLGEVVRRLGRLTDDMAGRKEDSAAAGTGGSSSRRELLAGGATVLAAMFGAAAQAEKPKSPEQQSPPESDDEFNLQRRLVNRCCFGATADELNRARALGHQGFLDYHLDYQNIDDSALDARLANYPTLLETPRQLINRLYVDQDYSPMYELPRAALLRQAYSKRQLFERVVDMWTDHFNIYMWKDTVAPLKSIDDRDVIRTHALGNFKDLLMASAKSPAMLAYLDNIYSYVGHPNQNYARELLELHTLGPGNYTQKDIEEVARCFTGWSINYDSTSENYGRFQYYDYLHDNGSKRCLGYLIGGNGIRDGETVIKVLTTGKNLKGITAKFLARKMARYFWGYEPGDALVQSIADAYVANDGDIKSMIRVVLSEESLATAAPKLKRPQHLVASSLRGLNAEPYSDYSIDVLLYFLDLMGNYPFWWVPPDGYPDSLEYWSGYILPRWRYATYLLLQESELGLDLTPLLGGLYSSVVAAINEVLFDGQLQPSEQRALRAYLAVDPKNYYRQKETIGLALAAPGYQWY